MLKISLGLLCLGISAIARADLDLKCTSSDASRLESHLLVSESEGVFQYAVTNCLGFGHSICEPYRSSGRVSDPMSGIYTSELVDIIPFGTGYEYIDKRGVGLVLTFDKCSNR